MKDLVVVTGENVNCLNINTNVKIQLAACGGWKGIPENYGHY